MLNTLQARLCILTAAAVAVALVSTTPQAAGLKGGGPLRKIDRAPLKEARMIIEYNASDEDIGVQVFLDGEGWRTITIQDPTRKEIFSAEAAGRLLKQGGGTELYFESVEPSLDDLPIETFFARFPEGAYRFRGVMVDGSSVRGRAEFTHVVPAGPVVQAPAPVGESECAEGVPIPAVIQWSHVQHTIFGEPVQVVRYEVIVEGEDVNYDVLLPAGNDPMMVTLSPELLDPDTDYEFEVLAIEEGGNQTITEGCFRTAP
jgi:hypothetical protein